MKKEGRIEMKKEEGSEIEMEEKEVNGLFFGKRKNEEKRREKREKRGWKEKKKELKGLRIEKFALFDTAIISTKVPTNRYFRTFCLFLMVIDFS